MPPDYSEVYSKCRKSHSSEVNSGLVCYATSGIFIKYFGFCCQGMLSEIWNETILGLQANAYVLIIQQMVSSINQGLDMSKQCS